MDSTPIQTITSATHPDYYTWALGLLGAVTRVCLVRGNGTELNIYKLIATLISGTVFAGTGGEVASMAGMGGFSIGGSAYIAGMFGMVLAEAAFNRTVGDKK